MICFESIKNSLACLALFVIETNKFCTILLSLVKLLSLLKLVRFLLKYSTTTFSTSKSAI